MIRRRHDRIRAQEKVVKHLSKPRPDPGVHIEGAESDTSRARDSRTPNIGGKVRSKS